MTSYYFPSRSKLPTSSEFQAEFKNNIGSKAAWNLEFQKVKNVEMKPNF